MKTYLLIALICLSFLGCAKKDSATPAPTVDLVGSWELVSFVVNPALADGTTDYLAYLRQLFGYNCSEINFFYNFKSDKTFTETIQSVCQSSGNTTDTVLDGTWTMDTSSLSITADDGSGTQQTQSYKPDLHPATAGKYASMTLTFTSGGFTVYIGANANNGANVNGDNNISIDSETREDVINTDVISPSCLKDNSQIVIPLNTPLVVSLPPGRQ